MLELTYTSESLRPYAADLGDTGQPFAWNEDRRTQLRAELDAAIMHIFGHRRADAKHVLNAFPVLREHEQRDHGHYRTRDLVLSEFDKMDAATTGQNTYRSQLSPAPGHGPRH